MGLITLGFAAAIGGRMPYFLLYFYGFTLIIPFLHCCIGIRWMKGELQLPMAEVVAGEEIKIKYSISNPLPISFPWLELENEFVYRLTGKREGKIIFPLAPKDILRGESVVVCRRRGLYETAAMQLNIGDVMGIFKFTKRIQEPIMLKVFPEITTLSYFKIKASQQIGDLKVTDPLFQDISDISDIKQYQIGDSIKKIHWRVSAKYEELMVKNYEERGDTEVLLLLDSHSNNYHDDKEYWIEDKLVETAASIIDYCLKQNIQITLCNADETNHRMIKGDNPQYLKKFMNELVTFHPNGNLEFEKQVEKTILGAQQGVTLLLLTPVLNKYTGAQGITLRRKNLNPVFVVIGNRAGEDQWQENKAIGKKLEMEGVSVYFIDIKQDIRDGLEGKYEKGS